MSGGVLSESPKTFPTTTHLPAAPRKRGRPEHIAADNTTDYAIAPDGQPLRWGLMGWQPAIRLYGSWAERAHEAVRATLSVPDLGAFARCAMALELLRSQE